MLLGTRACGTHTTRSRPGSGDGLVSLKENDLIGMFYDAALGKVSWNDVGIGLADILQGTTLNLFVTDPSGHDVDLVAAHHLDLQDLQRYAREFAPHDLWTNAALGGRFFNRGLIGSQIVPDKTLRRSIFYNEFLRDKYDSFRFLGAMQRMEGGGFTVISTHRTSDAPDFDPTSQRTLTRLLPHLGRSMEVRKHTQSTGLSGAFIQTLQKSTQGILFLDARGRILWANIAGARILAEQDGLQQTSQGLIAGTAKETRMLLDLVRSCSSAVASGPASAGGYISIGRSSGRYSYRCLVTPVGHEKGTLFPGDVAALFFVVDPEQPPVIEPDQLRKLFDLTPAEARVAAGLAMGERLPVVARRLGISHDTARTLLARATGKMGSDGQIHLVRTILTSVPGLRGPRR